MIITSTQAARRPPIEALTGLRFVAALSVAIAHGFSYMTVPPQVATPMWQVLVPYFAAFGMSAFFVLSGFVIHYNYEAQIRDEGWRGFANFLVARFARLYPLYIVCVLIDLNSNGYFIDLFAGKSETVEHARATLPYYLTMTQTWSYGVVDGWSMVYAFPANLLVTVSWSVSTEFFLYLAYPAVRLLITYLGSPRQTLIAIAALVVMTWVLLSLYVGYRGALDRFAVGWYGDVAGLSHGFSDSFCRWLLYFSPYARIPEFSLGCLVASLHCQLNRAPAALESRLGKLAGWFALVVILALVVDVSHGGFVSAAVFNFGFAVPVAVIIFSVSRYKGIIERLLSSRTAVCCGDCSYSIYMLHLMILSHAGLGALPLGTLSAFTAIVLINLIIALLTTIGLSWVTYTILEVPARQLLRRALSIPAVRLPLVIHPAP
jgi:peptidoglycan/LPS O-acetylase OafA/YrhL